MKKMIFGLALFVVGLISEALLIAVTVISPTNPWDINGIGGWLGCLIGMGLQIPFAIFGIIAVIGIVICIIEAFAKKEN